MPPTTRVAPAPLCLTKAPIDVADPRNAPMRHVGVAFVASFAARSQGPEPGGEEAPRARAGRRSGDRWFPFC
jgi:hypothetical protein